MTRKLRMKHGTEGPRHDPYGFTEYELLEDTRRVVLHLGLAERCTAEEGNRIVQAQGDGAGPLFERIAGMTVATFEKAWYRINRGYEEARAMERLAGWSEEP